MFWKAEILLFLKRLFLVTFQKVKSPVARRQSEKVVLVQYSIHPPLTEIDSENREILKIEHTIFL